MGRLVLQLSVNRMTAAAAAALMHPAYRSPVTPPYHGQPAAVLVLPPLRPTDSSCCVPATTVLLLLLSCCFCCPGAAATPRPAVHLRRSTSPRMTMRVTTSAAPSKCHPHKHGIAAPHQSSPSSFDSVLVGGKVFTLGTVSQCHEPMEDTGVCSATVQDFVPLQQCTVDTHTTLQMTPAATACSCSADQLR